MSETRSFDAPPGDDFVYLAAFQQLVLERSHDLITVTDPLGAIVYASPRGTRCSAGTRRRCSARRRSSSSTPTITGAPAPRCESRSTAARSTASRCASARVAGSWIAIEASGSAIRDAEGNVALSARHRPRRERARGAARPRSRARRALSHRRRDRAHDAAHRAVRRGRRDAPRRDRCRPRLGPPLRRGADDALRRLARPLRRRTAPRPRATRRGRRTPSTRSRCSSPDVAARASSPSSQAAVLREGIGALAFIPLVHDGRLLGKFMLYRDAPHEWSDREVRLCGTIANHLASATVRTRARDGPPRVARAARDDHEHRRRGDHRAVGRRADRLRERQRGPRDRLRERRGVPRGRPERGARALRDARRGRRPARSPTTSPAAARCAARRASA